MRNKIFARATAFLSSLLFGLVLHGSPRGAERPLHRASTEGSAKWEQGHHNAGCVLYAPDDECICDEFK